MLWLTCLLAAAAAFAPAPPAVEAPLSPRELPFVGAEPAPTYPALTVAAGTPIPEVRKALAASPNGIALTLKRGARAWTADEVEAILHRSVEARNVRVLDVSGNDIGSAGAMAIAASPHLSALRTLDLRGCRIGETGARGLAYSEGLSALDRLVVDASDPGPRGMTELRARYGERLIVP